MAMAALSGQSASQTTPTLLTRKLSFLGSTSIFFRVKLGVILKAPAKILEDQVVRERPSVTKYYLVEQQILDRLGEHPRIVKCFGWQTEFPTGLLLAEASHGSLQNVLDSCGDTIPASLSKRWFRQATEAVAYIHSHGVIHSDLRPDNFLVYAASEETLDLWLCDFGGSACEELGLDGGGLPDPGFFLPGSDGHPTPETDIFSLGSVLYTIATGHWPYREAGGLFDSLEAMELYEARVDNMFRKGCFPDTQGLLGGNIILGCWTKQYSNVSTILEDVLELGQIQTPCPYRPPGTATA